MPANKKTAKKKNKKSNIVLDFARGFLTKKENVAPAARFVKAQKRKKQC